MTLSTTELRASFAGAGTTGPFSFPYLFLADGDLAVIKRVDATGVETTLTLTTDYTVTGAANPAGGSVTTVANVASGETLVIIRDPDITQATDYTANDAFPAETHETALDKLTMIAQRSRDLQDRSLKLSETDSDSIDPTLPIFSGNGDKFVKIKTDATGLEFAASTADASAVATDIAGNATALETIKDAIFGDLDANDEAVLKAIADVDHLITLSGVAAESDDLGTFTGATIADNETIKGALQDLETALESGGSGLANVVEDTTPQLGGDLDVAGNSIVSVSNGDIPVTPNGTGRVLLTSPNIILGSDARGDMFYRGASNLERLAKGTNGQVLTMGANDPAWADASGGGGLVFLASTELSSDASVDFTAFDSSLYDNYLFLFESVIPATDGTLFAMRFKRSGQGSFDSGGSDYRYIGNTADSEINTVGGSGIGSAASEYGVSGSIWVHGAHDTTTFTRTTALLTYRNASGAMVLDTNMCGEHEFLADISEAQFFFQSGNLESGRITMFGVVNS